MLLGLRWSRPVRVSRRRPRHAAETGIRPACRTSTGS